MKHPSSLGKGFLTPRILKKLGKNKPLLREPKKAQESPGAPRRAQESPGEPRRIQQSARELPRRAQESPGELKRDSPAKESPTKESPRELRRAQESPGKLRSEIKRCRASCKAGAARTST